MATISEIVQNIIRQAKLLDPAISLEVGTPERKIVEAVAEQIAAAQVDIAVLARQHNIDQMNGVRLDAFMNNFGFARQLPTRASGTVTISRTTPGLSPVTIQRGTQFVAPATEATPQLYYTSLETAVIQPNELSREIFVECNSPGTIGNVPSNSISGFAATQVLGGFTFIRNTNPISGGKDGETDEQFKIRFKNTAFRHMAGTSDSYLALAVAQPGISKANVIGAQSRYIEYIQTHDAKDTAAGQTRDFDLTGERFPYKSTTTISTVPYSKYTYSTNYYLQDPTLGSGQDSFLKPNVDYVFNAPAWRDGASLNLSGNPVAPNITLLNPSAASEDDIEQRVLLFEHSYISKASRNDWASRIVNCVDIYVNGEESTAVSSREPVPFSSTTGGPEKFSNDVTSPYYRQLYRRTKTYTVPNLSSYIQVLYWQPVLRIPDTISCGNVVFTKNSDYFQIEDVSEHRGTVRARDGIEWTATALTRLLTELNGVDSIVLDYFFDSNISQLQTVVERNKQITTDVLVHKAKIKYLKLYLTVMYSPNSTPENVDKLVYSSVQTFLEGQYFGSAVQLSDLLQAIHNTPGIDNVRWTNEGARDPAVAARKVEIVTKEGESIGSEGLFVSDDFFLDDDELVALPNDVNKYETALKIEIRAQNTWNR